MRRRTKSGTVSRGMSAALFGATFSSAGRLRPSDSDRECPGLASRFDLGAQLGPEQRSYYVRMASGNMYVINAHTPVEAVRKAKKQHPAEGEATVTGSAP